VRPLPRQRLVELAWDVVDLAGASRARHQTLLGAGGAVAANLPRQ
jgi:hypothetical protein